MSRGEAISAALSAFSAATGLVTRYIGTPDIETVVNTAVSTGQAPVVTDPVTGKTVTVDILGLPAPGAVSALAGAAVAVPAAPATTATATAGWSDDWLSYGTVGSTLYAVPTSSSLKSLVWYDPTTFVDPATDPYPIPSTFAELVALTDTMIANGQTPWCVGIEAGPATGFVFTDWVEDRVLGSQPVSVYDAWIANDIGFADPAIREAWNDVIDLWDTPGAVFEGLPPVPAPGIGIAQTPFIGSLVNFATGGNDCLMHKQASFATGIVGSLGTFATFPFPADDAADSPALVSGNFAVALSDRADVAQVHEYLASADFADARQAAQAAVVGPETGFLSAVQGQDLSVRTPLEASFITQLQTATTTRFDASDLMPPQVGASSTDGGFWYEGTRATVGLGNTAVVGPTTYVGSTVDDASQAVANLFCDVAPGASCVGTVEVVTAFSGTAGLVDLRSTEWSARATMSVTVARPDRSAVDVGDHSAPRRRRRAPISNDYGTAYECVEDSNDASPISGVGTIDVERARRERRRLGLHVHQHPQDRHDRSRQGARAGVGSGPVQPR